jgi:uncharacterized membrane protein YphA (DoxX/SURF4 family)
MEYLIRVSRCFYGIGIAGIGIQQFIYSDFRPVLLSYWPSSIPGLTAWAYATGAALILAGAIISFSKKARMVSLVLGVFFFLLFLCFHVYYHLFLSPHSFHLGSWTDPLKELALSGGAFVIAVSFAEEKSSAGNKLFLILGRIFFSIMLIAFGIDHFLYMEFVATLVPGWIPGHIFWTYFAGVALIGSGVCILLKIKIRLVSTLLGIMLFLWFIMLHIPRAIVDPFAGKGNEITSAFEALAFSGIAFLFSALSWNELVSNRTSRQKEFG